MARYIGIHEGEFNIGENKFAAALKDFLDDSYIFYKNREVFGREFDFCLLIPDIGILVVEVKGWLENTLHEVSNDGATVLINTKDGIVRQTPWKQVRGYRFSLLRRIHNTVGKDPLVFSMLAYPNISQAAYNEKRLDTISEEEFTFLAEDFASPLAFHQKLNKAISLARNWGDPVPFNRNLMNQVRSIFESDIKTDERVDTPEADCLTEDDQVCFAAPYSRLAFISKEDDNAPDKVKRLIEQYSRGTKIYLIIEDKKLSAEISSQIDELLKSKNIRRHKDKLLPVFENKKIKTVNSSGDFHCFNFQVNILPQNESARNIESFEIADGERINEPEIEKELSLFDKISNFNLNQYKIEHSDSRKNVQVRAGAGTGKTHVMISRIVYLCYKEGVMPAGIKDRFVMITFTKEAAENMKQRLKSCFQNYYLLTKRSIFLRFISQIDYMNINTIHSYAKSLIEKEGWEIGFGKDIGIKNSKYSRREVLEEVLEEFIEKKVAIDRDYINKLPLPIYKLRDILIDFTERLINKNMNVGLLKPEQFGHLSRSSSVHDLIHELIINIIPETEKKYADKLIQNNALELGNLISVLDKIAKDNGGFSGWQDGQAPRYMFIDEFQDTDDVQIDTLLNICSHNGYNMFVVGDIKQCIYRFRGAEEKAFDRLNIDSKLWNDYILNKNYRTDKFLLEEYQDIFYQLNSHPSKLLIYDRGEDTLISSIRHNEGVAPFEFFKRIRVQGKDRRLPALFLLIKEIETKINNLMTENLSAEERTIAILVRDNWQAEEIRKAGKSYGYNNIITHTGGDLYQSTPAADLFILLNAMLNNSQPEYLYKLLESNFFGIRLSNLWLYNMRPNSWISQGDESRQTQVKHLSHLLDNELKRITDDKVSWKELLRSLRTKPILQLLRNLYQILQPWKHYSDDEWHQQFYSINVDLLFEKIIDTYNMDMLTVHTLAEFMHTSIVTSREEDCRWPQQEEHDISIVCNTVHKAKGLEYGWVILPHCDFSVNQMKYHSLDVAVSDDKIAFRIRGRRNDNFMIQNNHFQYDLELEERMREETRILYVAMTRAISSLYWIDTGENDRNITWQSMLKGEL